MKLQALCFVLAVLSVQVLPAQEKEPPTAQTKRGRDLFLKSQKGTPCATCHMMAGIGTAVGPNLANLTALATPRGDSGDADDDYRKRSAGQDREWNFSWNSEAKAG